MSDFGAQLPTRATPSLHGEATDLAARLARVESRNVTWMGHAPPFWTEALGANVRDANGRIYIDFTAAFGVALAGHRHPTIVSRIEAQLGRLVHGMGDIHPPLIKLELLEALSALLPWKEPRIILGSSGSDAVEAALKTAHLATGRPGILAFEGSYHGLALGALSATHRDHFRRPFTERLTDHVRFVPFPTGPEDVEPVLDRARAAMEEGAPVGAVIVEPIQGRAGVRVPPPGFLRALRGATRDRGALLIADEIFTGMGRTGTLLAGSDGDAVPDLVCLGKALGGGMPLSACCGPADVMDAWPPSAGEAVHTSTFLGHPLGCAGGLGFLDVLAREDLASRSRAVGHRALTLLREGLSGTPRVSEVRGKGLMIGVEIHPDSGLSGVDVAHGALARGLIVLPAGDRGQVVELTPPALLTDAQLEWGIETLVGAIVE